MEALEAAGERRDHPACDLRRNEAGRLERVEPGEAVRPRERIVPDGFRRALRPPDVRVIRAEAETELEPLEVEGDQVDRRVPLDGVEISLTVVLEDVPRDPPGRHHAHEDAGSICSRVPPARHHRARAGDLDAHLAGDEQVVPVRRGDERRARKARLVGRRARLTAGGELGLLEVGVGDTRSCEPAP